MIPSSCSTPSSVRTRRRSHSTCSQPDNLSEGWSTDLEGTELLDDIELANCSSIVSADSDFHRDLRRDFDQTLISKSDIVSDSDSEYLAAASAIETSDVFLDTSTTSESRPTSVISVIKMPAQTNKEKYLRLFRSCVMIWEDDYEGSDATDEIPEDLKDFIEKLNTFNTTLQDVSLYFHESPADEFGNAEFDKIDDLRKKCSQLKKLAKRRLADHTAAKAAADAAAAAAAATAAANAAATAAAASANTSSASDIAAADVAKLTITTMEPTVMAAVDAVLAVYVDLLVADPKTTGEYKKLVGRTETLEGDREKAVKQLLGLKLEAVAACDTDAAERYVLKLKEIQVAEQQLVKHVRDVADGLGFIPGAKNLPAANTNLKPPKFSGKENDGLDFYSFSEKLDEFFDVNNITGHHEMLVKLRTDCLTEPAADAVRNADTFSDAMEGLKKLYGQPKLLFQSRAKNVKKLGKCPKNMNEVRVWAINMKNELQKTAEIAVEHKITSLFDKTNLVETVEGFLKTRDLYKYRDQLKDYKLLNPGFDIENTMKRLTQLMLFLDELIDDSTFNLEFAMARGLKIDHTEKSKQNDKPATKKIYSAAPTQNSGDNNKSDPEIETNRSKIPKPMPCKNCDVDHTYLSYCPSYQNANNKNKFRIVCGTKACPRCLRMDAAFNFENRRAWYNIHKNYCTNEHICDKGDCAKRPPHFQNNVTLCPNHFDETHEEQDKYMQSLDQSLLQDGASFYFNMREIFNAVPERVEELGVPLTAPVSDVDGELTIIEPDVDAPAVYMLQMVPGQNGEKLLTFYDTGCYMAAMSQRAFDAFQTKTIRPGPTILRAAGNSTINVEFGDEQFLLPLDGGGSGTRRFATITALRMNQVSSAFPTWPLLDAWQSVQNEYVRSGGGCLPPLPTVEPEIGGAAVDLMVGIQYQRYFPQLIYSLPGGLGVYRAQFSGCGGHQGVLGGPSALWREVAQQAHFLGPTAYLVSELRAYRAQCSSLDTLISFDTQPETKFGESDELDLTCCERTAYATHSPHKLIKEMLTYDDLGSDIDYRCNKCRNCYDCKNSEMIEQISLQEEMEQYLIEKSVTYDESKQKVVAELPFLEPVGDKLPNNYYTAEKILQGQIRQANKRPGAIDQIEASHEKLVKRGFVCKLNDLPPELKKLADSGGYFIPWRTVQSDSLSTPTRMVFDASSRTKSGHSLNCLLAKGRNMLAEMLVLLFKFRFGAAAFCADVSMAYNGVLLHPQHLKFHKYLWVDKLAVGGAVIIMVILTLIYGVKPAGNLTMQAFKITAEKAAEDEQLRLSGGPECLKNNSYMDDVFAAYFNALRRDGAADGLVDTLAVGQMGVKAITKSGEPPCEKVSSDLESVNVVGYVWKPVDDTLSLDIKPLFLGKKVRGRRPPPVEGDVKTALRQKFTRRELAGKIAAVYDPLGLCVPVTARMKVCLREIIKLNSDWDALVPDEHLDTWVKILAEIQELKLVTFPRSILNSSCDETTKFELIVCTDSSQVVAAACVYLRVIYASGEVACGLLTAKSKLISNLTIPRAELRACVMGACLSAVVLRALGDKVSSVMFVTDSRVALTWLNTDQRPLQVGVRNAVIQIRRFSDVKDWLYVPTNLNPADIATREFRAEDIGSDSVWQRGFSWMSGPRENMPVLPLPQVEMSSDEKVAVSKEVRNSGLQGIVLNSMEEKVEQRYVTSKYIIDPCSMPWPKFVRKLAVVLRAAEAFKTRGDAEKLAALQFPQFGGKPVVCVSEVDVKRAENYLFKCATLEVKQFHEVSQLKDIFEKDDILWHSGRIMDGAQPSDPLKIMLDLSPLKFVCPVVDRWSPLAYAIMIHSHVTLTHHGGAVSSLRAAENIAFIMKGKSLAVEVIKDCAYCKRFRAKLQDVIMGPVPPARMTIAPAFYQVQVDLFGPVLAYCKHGRRSTIKVYGVVFKCATTLAVATLAMDGYDSASFLDAFYRFSARYGVPTRVYIDAGAQLISAFKEASFDIADLTKSLNCKYGVQVDFEVCPVGAHEAHGLVERSIREVKKVFLAVFGGVKMDVLRLETVFAWVSNELNSLPMCLGNEYRNLDHTDLITPNRLLLGRNNTRAVAGLPMDCQPSNVVLQNDEIQKAWWQVWVGERLRQLVPRPDKWRKGEPDVQIGDVVVFVRDKNEIGGFTWRIGEVTAVETSADGVTRRAVIQYKLQRANGEMEAGFRTTRRSTRHLAVIVREEELDLRGKLSAARRAADIMFCMVDLSSRALGELHTGPSGDVNGGKEFDGGVCGC